MSKQYDNKGKVSLWKNDKGGDKAPILRGAVFAHRDIKAGEEIAIALWKNDKGGERSPVLTGKVSDKYQAQEKKPAADDGFGDSPSDLPF